MDATQLSRYKPRAGRIAIIVARVSPPAAGGLWRVGTVSDFLTVDTFWPAGSHTQRFSEGGSVLRPDTAIALSP
jgi:hypothetical protein